jgi:protein NrfC
MDDPVKNDNDQTPAGETPFGGNVSRRQFVKGVGAAGAGAVLGGLFVKGLVLPDQVLTIPASKGYLLVDTQKCGGCTSCMLACSMTHHGESNLSLSRIQITQDPYGKFPDDITLSQCRQCPFPSCVEACPTGAMHADAETGVRTVDPKKCMGCERCVNACPFTPSRALWNFEEKHAQKCDLCKETTFWNKKDGQRACESVCPMHAIAYTTEIPAQSAKGYEADLRTGTPWMNIKFDGAVGATGVAGSGLKKK